MAETNFDVAVSGDWGIKILPVGAQWQAEVWDKGNRVAIRKFATRAEADGFKDFEMKQRKSAA